MSQLDVIVQGCDQLFTQAMDLWDTLEEDPTLQKLNTEIKEAQQQYDEISMMVCTLVPVQLFIRLQEGKAMLIQIQEFQKKQCLL